MAKGDVVPLDGILDQRERDGLPLGQLDEVFEYFAFEQILNDYDLSRAELDSGRVGVKDDGGIDGLFTIVNGHPLTDPGAIFVAQAQCRVGGMVGCFKAPRCISPRVADFAVGQSTGADGP